MRAGAPEEARQARAARGAFAEIFSSAASGCFRTQVAIRLRAELGERIPHKTALRMMHGAGIRCGIRREADRLCRNSYGGVVGETFGNAVGRDFSAGGPWGLGTDVSEFGQPRGKAYFAPACDFGGKGIVAWSTSTGPDIMQRSDLLDQLLERMPEGARPVLRGDMGWRCHHPRRTERLKAAEITQGMPGKGNCIDNGAAERVFGRIKEEFFGGRTWPDLESSKAGPDARGPMGAGHFLADSSGIPGGAAVGARPRADAARGVPGRERAPFLVPGDLIVNRGTVSRCQRTAI